MVAFSSDDILTYVLDNNRNAGGIDCDFYKYCDIGIKLYDDILTARFTFNVQQAFAKVGLAPKCWGFVELSDGRGAYLTEIATVAGDVDNPKFWAKYETLREKFQKKIKRFFPDIDLRDFHYGNWGFIGYQPVVIDVGHYSGAGFGSKYAPT